MSRTYEQLEPVISALDERIGAKAKQINALDTRVTAVEGALAEKADTDDVGDLSQLTTTAKDNLVTAINAAEADVEQLKADLSESVGDLNSAISHIDDDSFYYASRYINNTATGYRLNENDGFCTANASYKIIKYQVVEGDVIRIKSDDRFQFQSVASVPSSGTSNRIGVTYQACDGLFAVPSGATYLIMSTPTADSKAGAYTVYSKQDFTQKQLENVANLNLFTFKGATFGYGLNADGSTTEWPASAYTDYIPVDSETRYTLSGIMDETAPSYSMKFRAVEYDSSKAWIKEGAVINVSVGTQTASFRDVSFITSSTTAYVRISLEIASAITEPTFVNEASGGITAIDNVARSFQSSQYIAQIGFNANEIYKIFPTWEKGGIGSVSGANYDASNAIRTDFIDLLKGRYVKCIFNSTDSSAELRAFFYDENKTYLSVYKVTNEGSDAVIWRIPQTAKYIRFIIADWSAASILISLGAGLEYAGVIYGNLHDYIPSYYLSHLANKEEIVRSLEKVCSFNGDSFIFLTDPHYLPSYFIDDNYTANSVNANHSIPMVLDIIKNTGVRFIAFGGDLLNTSDGVDEMMQSAHIFNDRFKENKYRLMSIVGNHEYYTDLDNPLNGRPTANELYGGLIKINEDIILGKGPNNTYYFDNPVQKIRYFMVSCNRDETPTTEQVEWVLEAFLHIPSGYRLVVIGHAFLNATLTDFRESHIYIAQAMDAIIAGTSYTYNGNTYDYSALDNVEVVCILTGHVHVDGNYTSPGGTLCICTTCDCWKRNGEIIDGVWTEVPRGHGNIDEQAFDIVQFDFSNKKIYCTRIGYGSDREFSY